MITTLDGTTPLAHNTQMPMIGYGTWQVTDAAQATAGVKEAIAAGYRHIDTAAVYGNEEAVGRGIAEGLAEAGLSRKDLFVTTKLWNDHRGHDAALAGIEESLSRLGLDYVDLYLIHWPANSRQHPQDWRALNASTWSGMEEIYASGRARAIGVSNFTRKHLEALLSDASVAPMVNQIELHPGFGQWDTAECSKANGLAVEAWSPLGSGRVLGDPALGAVAAQIGRTPAQVALRWLLQQDIAILPKSVTPERIRSNAELFDFELSPAQMEAVRAVVDDTEHSDPDQVDF
ncbi:MAG: aldo/keto reductase [Actinomyces urogenitalis]|uniref:aldo/keto reductase n=1 Tax=uncultured Actinomyces sp. TaxID=249061 RepID=UPI0006615EE7|nr:aldo/keto reductase [uncultured Actinomyces sp.]MBS6071176.1 aldo/keto reductase [Actinomyces urogenitalis]MDU7428430.1 aldo/keto reductase [Actinomyces urogenitalis]